MPEYLRALCQISLDNAMQTEVTTSTRSSSSRPPNSCAAWTKASRFSLGLKEGREHGLRSAAACATL